MPLEILVYVILSGYICITPSGMDYEDLDPSDVVVVDEQEK